MIQLFKALLGMALWGSLVCLIVLAVRPFVKRNSSRIMCLLWMVVMFRFLCPFAIKSPVSVAWMENITEKIHNTNFVKQMDETEVVANPISHQQDKMNDTSYSINEQLVENTSYSIDKQVVENFSNSTSSNKWRSASNKTNTVAGKAVESINETDQITNGTKNIPDVTGKSASGIDASITETSVVTNEISNEIGNEINNEISNELGNITNVADTAVDETVNVVNAVNAAKAVNDFTGSSQATSKKIEIGKLLMYAFGIVWLIGSAIFMVIGVRRYHQIKGALREAIFVKKWKKYSVKTSNLSGVPMSFGVFEPEIYVPSSFYEKEVFLRETELSDKEKNMILWHEAMHLERHDPFLKLVAFVMFAIHWWNPLVWISMKCINQDIEMACDETVLAHIGQRRRGEYAQTLLNFATEHNGISLMASFGENNAESRIKNALRYRKSPAWQTALTMVFAVVLGCCLIMKPVSDKMIDGTLGDASDDVKSVSDGNPIQSNSVSDGNPIQANSVSDGNPIRSNEFVQNAVTLFDGNHDVLHQTFMEHIYTLDSNGNKNMDVDLSAYREDFAKYGINPTELIVFAAGDDCVFFHCYDLENYYVYAIDVNTHVITQIKTGYWSNFFSADYYDGKVYVSVQDTEEDKKKTHEYVFVKDGDGFKCIQDDANAPAYVKATETYDVLTLTCDPKYNTSSPCMKRTLDEVGYLIGKGEDDQYVKITEDGSITTLNQCQAFAGRIVSPITAYDEHGNCIYREFKSDELSYQYAWLDLETGETKILLKASEGEYLGYADEKLYSYTSESLENGNVRKHVYQTLLSTGEKKELYTYDCVAEDQIASDSDMFRIINGKIYFIAGDEGLIRWVRVDEEDGSIAFTDITCPLGDNGVLKYGNMTTKNRTVNCQNCGIPLMSYQQTYFQLDAKYSDKADQINQTLLNFYEEKYKEIEETFTEFADKGDEQEHEEFEPHYEYKISPSDVKILQDKYLQVGFQWYTEISSWHYHIDRYNKYFLFDLSTGKQITLQELFGGTEEEFKTFVATKTKEKTESYVSATSLIGDSYDQAYGMASFENTNMKLDEDGAWIIYEPYTLSLNDGPIEVFVTYEEFLGRSQL